MVGLAPRSGRPAHAERSAADVGRRAISHTRRRKVNEAAFEPSRVASGVRHSVGYTGGLQEEVASATEQWAKHFSAQSPEALLALYEKEAVVLGTRSSSLSADATGVHAHLGESLQSATGV